MEVKEIYLDLKKVEKKGKTTFILEDEKFDKPLELKLCYDDKDKSYLEQIKSEVESMKEFINNELEVVDEVKKSALDLVVEYKKEANILKKDNEELERKLANRDKGIKNLLEEIEEQNKTIETLRGTINHLEEKNAEIEKKLTKQPRLFKDKIFISGREEVVLGVYDIPDGDYLCITSFVIGEHNEYVENKDGVTIEKIHIQDGFTPTYQLYGGTELDTPTAMVYFTLLLIPL